jgi:hypothetical protein
MNVCRRGGGNYKYNLQDILKFYYCRKYSLTKKLKANKNTAAADDVISKKTTRSVHDRF